MNRHPCKLCMTACRYRTPSGCALALASEGPRTPAAVARILGMPTSEVRMLEAAALATLARSMRREDYFEGPPPRERAPIGNAWSEVALRAWFSRVSAAQRGKR